MDSIQIVQICPLIRTGLGYDPGSTVNGTYTSGTKIVFVKFIEKLKARMSKQNDTRQTEKTQGPKYKLLRRADPIR